MIHKTLKAATTTQDRGIFTALAATYSLDRDGERIAKGAFADTIKRWQESEKNIPLHFNHSAAPEDIIGWVEPKSMQETDDGLVVKGQLDLEQSEVAREVWRSMKNNAVALSFGFLSESRKGKDGVIELYDIDLYEISIVGAPANPDTRLLSLKGVDEKSRDAVEQTIDDLKDLGLTLYEAPQPEFEDIEAVKSYVADKFPDFEVTEKKSEPDLRKRSLDIALEVANDFKPREQVEPEPEPPEPVDPAEVRWLSERAVVDAALL